MLAKGADPNMLDENGEPVLIVAARGGSAATVDALLVARADVEIKNRFGDTALMIAALSGHVDVAKKLRARGAAVNPTGWTPLIYAATGGRDDMSACGVSIRCLSSPRSASTELLISVARRSCSTCWCTRRTR